MTVGRKPRAIQWLKTLWARCGGIFMWQRQVDIYEASLVYIGSSKPARTTQYSVLTLCQKRKKTKVALIESYDISSGS